MTAPDSTPDVPVFRLVVDTERMSARDRYRLAEACGLIEAFTPAPAAPAADN